MPVASIGEITYDVNDAALRYIMAGFNRKSEQYAGGVQEDNVLK